MMITLLSRLVSLFGGTESTGPQEMSWEECERLKPSAPGPRVPRKAPKTCSARVLGVWSGTSLTFRAF